VCLAQLQTTPNPKNQLHSKFFRPNTNSSSSSTADLLQEKAGARPQIHGFGGVPLEALHKTKFGGVGGNYPPLPVISGKKWFASILPRHICCEARDSPVPLPRAPGRPCAALHAGEAAPARPAARLRPSCTAGGKATRACLPRRRRGHSDLPASKPRPPASTARPPGSACIEAAVRGPRELHLPRHGERYEVDCPNLLIRLLPAPSIECSDDVRVECAKSKLEAHLSFYWSRCSFLDSATTQGASG
jgi:hypothetical protein